MTDHDDLLKELDAALNVEPSRAFAEGVRARVRRSQVRTTQMWWGLAAAATVTLGVLFLWRPAPAPAVQVARVEPPQVQVPAPATLPTPTVVTTAPGRALGGRVFRPGTASAVRVAANTSSEPRLEVITNQPAVLQQLWADARGRTLVIVEAEPPVDGMSPRPIEVSPLELRPLVVNEIGKEPGPAGASPVIRRANATKETK